MIDFQNKTAVITGAGSGFGREFARIAASLGMNVVLADIQRDALLATQHELEATGTTILARPIDVSNGAQVDALADETFDRFGAVHLLFNNAGVGTAGLIWENSERDWAWTLGVNLWGVIHGIRAFVPRMLDAARHDANYNAHIVNTASMAGLLNPPASGVYNVSKHAVVSLSETLHHDLALVTQQVHASVLCPYFVPTGIHDSRRNRPADLANDAPLTRSQRVAEAMVEKAVTSGRVSAEDVARATFDAIRDQRFYIASHPQALDAVRQRGDDIAALRNPADPFAAKPAMRDALVAALRD
jgi:NAD(P)-dependent dehydrogenase (short-subunit alcohol dehydrogenase family)